MKPGKIKKTNAARLLDRLGIEYELRSYEVDPEDLSAETVARKVGLPPERVFKTLLAKGDRSGFCFAVVPANGNVNLALLARAAGDKKTELVPVAQLESLTGYIRGGVTVLAAKRSFPVYVDRSIEACESISLSAGLRGLQIILRPQDYIRAAEAKICELL